MVYATIIFHYFVVPRITHSNRTGIHILYMDDGATFMRSLRDATAENTTCFVCMNMWMDCCLHEMPVYGNVCPTDRQLEHERWCHQIKHNIQDIKCAEYIWYNGTCHMRICCCYSRYNVQCKFWQNIEFTNTNIFGQRIEWLNEYSKFQYIPISLPGIRNFCNGTETNIYSIYSFNIVQYNGLCLYCARSDSWELPHVYEWVKWHFAPVGYWFAVHMNFFQSSEWMKWLSGSWW